MKNPLLNTLFLSLVSGQSFAAAKILTTCLSEEGSQQSSFTISLAPGDFMGKAFVTSRFSGYLENADASTTAIYGFHTAVKTTVESAAGSSYYEIYAGDGALGENIFYQIPVRFEGSVLGQPFYVSRYLLRHSHHLNTFSIELTLEKPVSGEKQYLSFTNCSEPDFKLLKEIKE